MFRPSSLAMLLWLLAVALLPVRMANAHLHLCLDGQDAPVAVHVDDVPTHHGSLHAAHAQGGHNDVDVDVSASVSVKKGQTIDDVAPYVLGAYVVALVQSVEPQLVPLPSAEGLSTGKAPFDLHPPSRGPPSLASL